MFSRCTRRTGLSSLRLYSTSPLVKPNIKLVTELRKTMEVSMVKARDALTATNNDLTAAIEWLQKDLVASGAQKAAKVEGRVAGEGLIGVCLLSGGIGSKLGNGGVRAAMIELNCETDFVGRNEVFGKLAADIAHTTAFLAEPADSDKLFKPCSLDMLYDAPLLSQARPDSPPEVTIGSSVHDAIVKLGEKIVLRRAVAIAQPPLGKEQPNIGLRPASYLHGSVNNPLQGRIGTLALLALKSPRLASLLSEEPFLEDLAKLERSIARQIVGFDTRLIKSSSGTKDETALYEQPFMMFPGGPSDEPVYAGLQNWARQRGLIEEGSEETGGIEVLEFTRWTVGEKLQQ